MVAGEVIRRYASGAMAEEQEPQDRHPQGEAAGGFVLVIIADGMVIKLMGWQA